MPTERLPPSRGRRACCGLSLLVALLGCEPHPAEPEPGPRPSILLVVVDTLRADAVSAYGAVAGTTPHIDAVAERGLRYTRAYAPASWTVPSHASLLSGTAPERHRIGVSERITAGADLVMLAERLRDAGYETAAFIENPIVGAPFGFDQGFERFAARTLPQLLAEFTRPGSSGFDVVQAFDAWAVQRDRRRPFFAFVNLFEAHEPYRVRSSNRFLPPGTTPAAVARVRQSTTRICDALPPPDELAILRGLYLGDVAAADVTLGALVERTRALAGTQPLVTIVTSDHGEHLGEHRLLDHQFTVREVATHVPLVVEVPGGAAGVIDTPVTLVDVAASILGWARVGGATPLDGRPLPTTGSSAAARDLVASYVERPPVDWPLEGKVPGATGERKRTHCTADDRVHGDMVALTRYPWKLVWYSLYPAELFHLSDDPDERADRAGIEPSRAEAMRTALVAHVRASGLFRPTGDAVPDPRAVEALRALGYVE